MDEEFAVDESEDSDARMGRCIFLIDESRSVIVVLASLSTGFALATPLSLSGRDPIAVADGFDPTGAFVFFFLLTRFFA